MINVNIYPREPEYQHLLELYPVQPANKFLPDWYKKSKKLKRIDQKGFDGQSPHAKECPAIQDEMTNGFVIPAWSDMYFDIKNGDVNWEITTGRKIVRSNLNKEYQWMGSQNTAQISLMGLNAIANYGVLKLMTPYYFETPKGYGLRFSDMFYHDKKHIRVLPGQVETDIWHEVNFPFEFILPLEMDTKFVIEAGEPLVMVTPYKKDTRYKLNNKKYDEDFIYKQDQNGWKLTSIAFDFKKHRLHKSLDEEE